MDRRILVVDDSVLICRQLSQLLAGSGRQIKLVHDATTALELLVEKSFSLVLVDLILPGITGLDLIHEIRHRDIPVTVIAMTGHASVDSAVAAMKLGAFDYLPKPIDPSRLNVMVEQALQDRRLLDEIRAMRQGLRERIELHNLQGKSSRMREVFDKLARVATTSCNVLVTGETGTGKELVVHAIHYAGARDPGPLVAVNCAALPEPLLESELFGHEKGAFTGADQKKKGRFEQAKGGTLLLDEIGELPVGMQAKLLRVLQDGAFERVGGTDSIRADCRIIATTNIDLDQAVADGRFREDLFFRLNVLTIDLPPLRDRLEDVPLLVQAFLQGLAERRLPAKTFTHETLSRLQRYDWPGNVRELEHLIEQLVVTTPGPEITPNDLPGHIVSKHEAPFSLDFDLQRPLPSITDELTERIERAYLSRVLELHRGRIEESARHCGLSRRSISEKLRRYGIDKSEFKSAPPRTRAVRISLEPRG